MTIAIERSAWSGYLKDFNHRNAGRTTRMEVFGEMGAQPTEHDLAFNGIALEEHGHDAPKLEIMLGTDTRHLTHNITNVTQLTPKQSADGSDETLEIQDASGNRTLLSFTAHALLSAAV
ncbi:MAG: DUF5335 family protein [Acidobacteria bacterium]|nr:DUF5335 family protein [Acidobacteriota bacterium]